MSGRVILWMSVSLDGFMEDRDHGLGWHHIDEELHAYFNDQLRRMGAFVSGRVTYELMAGYWPTADADPSASPTMAEFAAIWRAMPKIVYSRTLERAAWGTTIEREVSPAGVARLKASVDGDLVLGGAELAASFLRLDLIDEVRLFIHPIAIGDGRPLFPPLDDPLRFRLLDSRRFGNGVVMLRYAVGAS